MSQDAQLIFADHVGRFYARHYGFPPIAGRVLGYLLDCDPPQTIDELSDTLLASRNAITGGRSSCWRAASWHDAPGRPADGWTA